MKYEVKIEKSYKFFDGSCIKLDKNAILNKEVQSFSDKENKIAVIKRINS